MAKICNIGIVAHVDAGKTTVTEQLLYAAGQLRAAGSVDSGTAQTDFLAVERARGISVRASTATFSYHGTQVNLIDTPGHVDFAGEVERSLGILDCAVLVVSAVEGVQAQTEILLETLLAAGTSTVVFINKIDRAGSDVDGVLAQLRRFCQHVLPCEEASREGGRDCGVRLHPLADPAFQDEAVTLLSDGDEDLMEAYLTDGTVSEAMLQTALQQGVSEGRVMPVLYGSALCGVGIHELLDFLVTYLQPKEAASDVLSGVIYKITHDPVMGKLAHVRMYGGVIRNRDSVYLPSADKTEKVTQIRKLSGARHIDVGEVTAGDIAALCGLTSARIGDVIGSDAAVRRCSLATPLLQVQAIPSASEQLYPLIAALEELTEEDPLLEMEFAPQEQEIHIKITGMIQLEILTALLKERYNLDVSFSPPTVIYKETPSKAGEGFEAYTMPKPCWAVIRLAIEPAPRGSGLAYSSIVPNNDIFYRYQNHIETAVPRALKQGLYNWEVTDLKVTLIGGEHHTIHTHPMDFFLATPMAVMNGLQNTGTTLLEPMVRMRLSAQEDCLGKVIGDMIAMRGEFDSPVVHGGTFTMEARVPVATSLDYAVRLAVLTSGKGVLSTRFDGYQECPLELGAVAKRRGVNPLDRAKWILSQRNALMG